MSEYKPEYKPEHYYFTDENGITYISTPHQDITQHLILIMIITMMTPILMALTLYLTF